MLDLGCGNGRHSKRLALKGFNVTGMDLAASSIREAKKAERPGLRFYRQDMRTAFGESAFDYVFSFFTSFGYFTDLRDDNKVTENISKALKTGGTFVLDYINPVYAEKNLKATEEKEIDGVVYSIRRWVDEAWFFKKISLDEQLFSSPLEYTEQVRKFSITDLVCLLSKHGLRVQKIFGDYRLNEYAGPTSPRMILVAQKTGRGDVGILPKNKRSMEHA